MLLVDDEHLIAMDIAEQLNEAGAFAIGPASTMESALELASAGDFEAAILDIKLGDELVYPVADLLRHRRVPFVFATGYHADDLPAKYAAVPVCAKPFDIGEVVSTLHSITGKRAQDDE